MGWREGTWMCGYVLYLYIRNVIGSLWSGHANNKNGDPENPLRHRYWTYDMAATTAYRISLCWHIFGLSTRSRRFCHRLKVDVELLKLE